MANVLNEMDAMHNQPMDGRPVNVIPVQVAVEPAFGATTCVRLLQWGGLAAVPIGIMCCIASEYFWEWEEVLLGVGRFSIVMGIPMSIVGFLLVALADQDLSRQEQKINEAASTVDNYRTQRTTVIQTMEQVVKDALNIDEKVFNEIAEKQYGAANGVTDTVNEHAVKMSIVLEQYPELRSHKMLQTLAQQDANLVSAVTVATNKYNSAISVWNEMVFGWPFYQYVAGIRKYTTRVPYVAPLDIRKKSESILYHQGTSQSD